MVVLSSYKEQARCGSDGCQIKPMNLKMISLFLLMIIFKNRAILEFLILKHLLLFLPIYLDNSHSHNIGACVTTGHVWTWMVSLSATDVYIYIHCPN